MDRAAHASCPEPPPAAPPAPAGPRLRARTFLEPANLLSLARVPMAGLVWVIGKDPLLFLLLAAVAGLTDILDGRAARAMAKAEGRAVVRSGGVGDWLDPLCDKIFVASAVVAAGVLYRPPLYVVGLVLLRDAVQMLLVFLLVPLLWHRRLRIDYRANQWGKATTVAQFVTLLAIVFYRPAMLPLAALSAILGTTTVTTYAKRAAKEVRADRTVGAPERGGSASDNPTGALKTSASASTSPARGS